MTRLKADLTAQGLESPNVAAFRAGTRRYLPRPGFRLRPSVVKSKIINIVGPSQVTRYMGLYGRVI